MGRSRGGLTTKLHAMSNSFGEILHIFLSAGQANDGNKFRQEIAKKGAIANIALMPHRVEFPAFDKEIYKQRNVIERCFGRLKLHILDIYRFRWQVEIYFKRLKSIMDFGELPKRRDGSIMSWLHVRTSCKL